MEREQTQGHILIISHDVVGAEMAGPGIRYYHLARVLGREFDTIFAIPNKVVPNLQETTFRVFQYRRRDWTSVAHLASAARVVIVPSDIASDFPQLARTGVSLIVDGYDPLLAEWLALNQCQIPQNQRAHWWSRMRELNQQYLMGDFFICASERQRDWWLGLLEANGRINPWTFQEDPSLRRLIDVVSFGLPSTSPQHTRQVIRGVWPGIKEMDRVILWGGGLWPWLDPLTAVRAVAKIWQQRQDVRLLFPGTRHPAPWMAKMPTHNEVAIQTAQELGLLDRAVFFGKWVPYADWPNVLLESDVALTLHYDTMETRLAFRSRVLDYIWAELPVVATQGDATSELVAKYGVGIVVGHKNVDSVAEAILHLLELPRQDFSDRFEKARQFLTWEQAARPLVEFCRCPRRAPDKVALGETIGNAFYLEEITQLRALVHGYERGRFIRFMRHINEWRRKRSKNK